MALKPNGKTCVFKEQIIEDIDLTLQIEARSDGGTVLRVFGQSLTYGNRELFFDTNGKMIGAGTHLQQLYKPSWLRIAQNNQENNNNDE